MPVQSLPSNPSFENLRKQSKSLLKAVHNGEPDALTRVREFHPKRDEAFTNFTLSAAQLVTARSYAFPSWSGLKQHLEVLDQHSLLPGPRHLSEVAAQEQEDTENAQRGALSRLNPTHGSGWIVQVHSTKPPTLNLLLIPPTEVGGYFKSVLRLDLNNPPTGVGGIQFHTVSLHIERT